MYSHFSDSNSSERSSRSKQPSCHCHVLCLPSDTDGLQFQNASLNPALEPFGETANRRVTISERRNQHVDMIWHRERGENCPLIQSRKRRATYIPGAMICQHVHAIGDAECNEVDRTFFPGQRIRNTRRSAHQCLAL